MLTIPGQPLLLQVCCSLSSPPHSLPPNNGCCVIDLYLPWEPPPQVTEQVSHALHSPQVQFTVKFGSNIYASSNTDVCNLHLGTHCYCMTVVHHLRLHIHSHHTLPPVLLICFSPVCPHHRLQSMFPMHSIDPMCNLLNN